MPWLAFPATRCGCCMGVSERQGPWLACPAAREGSIRPSSAPTKPHTTSAERGRKTQALISSISPYAKRVAGICALQRAGGIIRNMKNAKCRHIIWSVHYLELVRRLMLLKHSGLPLKCIQITYDIADAEVRTRLIGTVICKFSNQGANNCGHCVEFRGCWGH